MSYLLLWCLVLPVGTIFTALLNVDKEEKLLQAKDKDHLLDVTQSDVFYGGIPPTVNMDVYRKASKYVLYNFYADNPLSSKRCREEISCLKTI